MTKKYIYQTVDMPASLAQSFDTHLKDQMTNWGRPVATEAEISRLLIDTNQLDKLDRRVLESQKRLYDASRLQINHRSVLRRLNHMAHRTDVRARQVIGDNLGFDDLPGLADSLLELQELDPALVRALVSGALGTALRLIPSQGYDEDFWTLSKVMDVVDLMSRLWIAHDLQLEAAACHARMFRPTGCDVLDGLYAGSAPREGRIAAAIEAELKLFEAASRIYHRNLHGPARDPLTIGVDPGARRLLVERPLAAPGADASSDMLIRPFGLPASSKETAIFRKGDLEQRAHEMLAIWRDEHGDELEEFLRVRMADARDRLISLRRAVDEVRSDPSLARRQAHLVRGPGALSLLWLACERAVAWTAPADHGENAIERAMPTPLEAAISAARASRRVERPIFHRANVRRVRELFIALRCTIVRDPDHVPQALRMIERNGKTVRAGTAEKAARLRGSTITFGEIWEHILERDTHAGREALSNSFTRPANAYVRAHQANPAAAQVIEHAWGTAEWRLQQ